MRAKTACACCDGPKKTQKHNQWRCFTKENCIQARWPLRRENACVLKDAQKGRAKIAVRQMTTCHANTPAAQHTLLQTRDTMSARARTAAGSRERGRPRAAPGVFCRGVSMCAWSKKDGSAFFAKRRHRVLVQLGLTRERAEPLLHLKRHVRLAPLCTGLSWLVVASTIASCCRLVTSGFCCHACDVCGHRELHRLPTSPRWWLRPQLFDTAVHGVDELTETLPPVAAIGRPPNTTCTDT